MARRRRKTHTTKRRHHKTIRATTPKAKITSVIRTLRAVKDEIPTHVVHHRRHRRHRRAA